MFVSLVEDGKSVLYGVVIGSYGCGQPDVPGMTFANIFSLMSFIYDVLVRLRIIITAVFFHLFIFEITSKSKISPLSLLKKHTYTQCF